MASEKQRNMMFYTKNMQINEKKGCTSLEKEKCIPYQVKNKNLTISLWYRRYHHQPESGS